MVALRSGMHNLPLLDSLKTTRSWSLHEHRGFFVEKQGSFAEIYGLLAVDDQICQCLIL